MNPNDFIEPHFKWICLSTLAVTFLYGIGKSFFLFKISEFQIQFPSLKEKLPAPKALIYFVATFSLLTSLLFAYLALFHTKANEIELNESQQSVDVLFVIDVSYSMNAIDVKPTRLKRFQDIVLRLLPHLAGNRLGIILFAGNAFSYCPMTSDVTAFSDYVNSLGTDMVGKKGTDLSTAIKKAEATLSSSKLLQNRVIVLVSDGEDHESSQLKELNSEVFVWGFGTEEGGPIFYSDPQRHTSGYVTHSGGLEQNPLAENVIISKLNEETLKSFASLNEGEYANLSFESMDAYRLTNKIADMKKNQTNMLHKSRKEDGAFFYLFLAIVFFFIERGLRFFYFPKTKFISLLAFALFFVPPGSEIYSWDLDPAGETISKGIKAYENKQFSESKNKFKEAENYFKDDYRLKFNQSASSYKMGNWNDSLQLNEEIQKDSKATNEIKAKALYNSGNAYFRKNDFRNARKLYEEALDLDPNLSSAKKNLEFLHKKEESRKQEEKEESGQSRSRNKENKENQSRSGANSGSGQAEQEKQNKSKKDPSKENADRMMDQFSPNSILKNKSKGFQSPDNEKFW